MEIYKCQPFLREGNCEGNKLCYWAFSRTHGEAFPFHSPCFSPSPALWPLRGKHLQRVSKSLSKKDWVLSTFSRALIKSCSTTTRDRHVFRFKQQSSKRLLFLVCMKCTSAKGKTPKRSPQGASRGALHWSHCTTHIRCGNIDHVRRIVSFFSCLNHMIPIPQRTVCHLPFPVSLMTLLWIKQGEWADCKPVKTQCHDIKQAGYSKQGVP